MRYGTSHFVSKDAAVRYYRPYGYNETSRIVEHKLKDGEIHIGEPELKNGETCYLNADEGRYFVTDGAE